MNMNKVAKNKDLEKSLEAVAMLKGYILNANKPASDKVEELVQRELSLAAVTIMLVVEQIYAGIDEEEVA